MKKWIKITLLSVLGLIIVAGVLTWIEFGSIIQGALSAEKLDDGMYYMEYKGDDGFKELMKRGGSKDINDLANYTTEFLSKGYFKTAKIDCPVMPVGCSTLTVRTPEGGAMMARNFDYPYGTAMIMHVTPDEGYESITTFSTDFYGFGEGYKPEGFKNQYMVVTESPFVTNHYLCTEKFQAGLHESDHRHEKLMEQYDKAGGIMNEKKLTDAIVSVTQLPEKGAIVGGTLWTIVMDLTHPSVTYYSRRHFDKPFRFELER